MVDNGIIGLDVADFCCTTRCLDPTERFVGNPGELEFADIGNVVGCVEELKELIEGHAEEVIDVPCQLDSVP